MSETQGKERTALKAVGSQIVENGESIAVVWYDGTPEGFEKAKARAALIVRAVNSFPALEKFVQAYDTWRAAEDEVGSKEELVEYSELEVLCATEAKAAVALIEARAALTEATGGK